MKTKTLHVMLCTADKILETNATVMVPAFLPDILFLCGTASSTAITISTVEE